MDCELPEDRDGDIFLQASLQPVNLCFPTSLMTKMTAYGQMPKVQMV